MISIVGSGLTGLSCAIHLLDSSIPVEIYEARQEIGNPIRSPGLLRNFNPKYIENTDAVLTPIGWGFRREWLEKNLAKEVLSNGGIIHLKKTITNVEEMVDCRGGKSVYSGWPGISGKDEVVQWKGGITLENDVPGPFILNTIQENNLSFIRGDGLVECWIKGDILPENELGWLEIMSGEHPENPRNISGDEAIEKGIKIAKNIIQYNQGGMDNASR